MNDRIRNGNFVRVKGTNLYGTVISTDPKNFNHVVKFSYNIDPYYYPYFTYELEKISEKFIELN